MVDFKEIDKMKDDLSKEIDKLYDYMTFLNSLKVVVNYLETGKPYPEFDKVMM